MALVPQAQRLQSLEKLGISAPLLRLTAGELRHPLLAYRCMTPPERPYVEGVEIPPGRFFLPLWDGPYAMTGVWAVAAGRPQFVRIPFDPPASPAVLAGTEQGLFATLFVNLYEDHDLLERSEFLRLAELLGFAHVNLLFDTYEASFHGSFSVHAGFLDAIVEHIDHLTGAA